MKDQLSWKVGGQQGEGIESTGEIFSTTLNRMGYHLYSYRHFSSRIKGGHTNNNVRISVDEVRSVADNTNILVAFDQQTIDVNYKELVDDGIIIADSKFDPAVDDDLNVQLVPIPFTEIAKEQGSQLMKNMVAIGASARLMNLQLGPFRDMIHRMFIRKGEETVESNNQALKQGYNAMGEEMPAVAGDFEMKAPHDEERLFLIGNDAISFEAINAGVRFMPAYPITPASEIMEYMIARLPKLGGTVIQTEDEIAAATFVAQSVSSDIKELTSIIQPAIDHKGFSFVNVFSPCVTYNKVNTYDWFKEHLTSVDDIDSFDMHDSKNAMKAVMEYDGLLKGIIYHDEHAKSYQEHLGEYQDSPLISREMRLERENFDEMMSEFR